MMKLAVLLSAAVLATAPMAVPAPVAAQTVARHGGYHRPHVRRVCRWTVRHHRRVRVCRTVRY